LRSAAVGDSLGIGVAEKKRKFVDRTFK